MNAVLYLKHRLRHLHARLFGYREIHHVINNILPLAYPTKSEITMFDVGAAKGAMSLSMMSTYPNCRLHAFEPNPEQFTVLQQRLSSYKNVSLVKSAVGSISGEATLHIADYSDASSLLGHAKLLTLNKINTLSSIQVPLTSLDDYISSKAIANIDFLKIDVEGFEKDVLLGGTVALQKTSNVFVEISQHRHDPHCAHILSIFSLMRDAGFSFIDNFGDYFFTRDESIKDVFINV